MISPQPLTKKELGKRRYDRRQTRGKHAQDSQRRTRPSDRGYPRITDGIPANYEATRIHAANVWGNTLKRKPAPQAASLEALKELVDNLDPRHFASPK